MSGSAECADCAYEAPDDFTKFFEKNKFEKYLSFRAFSGADSLKSITVEVFLRCEWINIIPPPPIPVICGSAMARQRDVATAASIAFPP